MKQRYASQLSDRNNASIAKTLLKQMPQITFTQFRNELARVLGTRQHAAVTKASVKTIMAASMETESEEEGALTKSQTKKDGKINAQSSQIKDLHSKLDQAVAENSQIREFLSPTSLQKAFTSALQAAQVASDPKDPKEPLAQENDPFWENAAHLSSQLGLTEPLTQKKAVDTVRIWDTCWRIASGYKPKRHSKLLYGSATKQWVKLMTPASQGHGCRGGVKVDPLSSSVPAAFQQPDLKRFFGP